MFIENVVRNENPDQSGFECQTYLNDTEKFRGNKWLTIWIMKLDK